MMGRQGPVPASRGLHVATPADWQQDDDVVIAPGITDPKELAERCPKGCQAVPPHRRLAPQPNQ